MMMQQPPIGDDTVHTSMMNQHHQPQPQPTTSTAQEEEVRMIWTEKLQNWMDKVKKEEVRMIWMGELQNWMDKVEEKEVRTLWIGDLQHWMDEAYIDSCFSHTGEVFTSKVIRNGKSSDECYGFIEFKSHAIADRFLHKFNGTPMPRVPVGTTNFSLNWATKVVVTDGTTTTTTTPWNEIPTTTTTTTTGQCGVNCMFRSTTSIPILPSISPATNENTLGIDDSQFSRVEMGDYSSWVDMLKWWSLSQSKGTCTARTVHATNRVYEIAAFLKRPPIKLEEKCLTPTAFEIAEGLLDELQSHVNSINVAKELHSMGALEPLLCNMSCIHAGVGANAAKVVCTMVQKDLMSEQLVMEAGGEEHLFYTFFRVVDETTLANVISAISSLFRNNKHITAFRQSNGYASLIDGLNTVSVISQRTNLNLIRCLLLEHKSDCNIVTGLRCHHIMMDLVASSYCAKVREAALRCLLLLTEVEGGGNSDQLVKNDDKLKQVLQKRIKRISAMAQEDLGAAREEIQLVDSLWNACYNEPSCLREKGLLVLPDEDMHLRLMLPASYFSHY